VHQWFSQESAKGNNVKPDFNIYSVKFSITPPPLKLGMVSSNSFDSQGSDETEIDLKSKLVFLLPTGATLSESTLTAFGRIMNTHNKNLADIAQILTVIENTKRNPQVLNRFIFSKLFKVLCNMKQIILESNNVKIQELYLDVFTVLPFDLGVFNDLKIPKYFKQKWEGTIKDKRNDLF
jgi:hypothetical protein